jgi:hypothetical protein
MDRSFLSQPEVVAASQKFVCIRLSTYENAQEVAMLGQLFRGGSGQVENTTFAILDPSGQRPLVRCGRSPDWAFANAQAMASQMDSIADGFRSAKGDLPTAPLEDNLRLAINVAACDGLPVVVRVGQQGHLSQLSQLAWDEKVAGRAVFCLSTAQESGLSEGLWVLRPDAYGQKASPLANLPQKQTKAALIRILQAYQAPPKEVRQHIREGMAQRVYWKTAVPVTDPHERGGPPGPP